jgi:hypothetical protein
MGNMHDHRVICRTVLGGEDSTYSFWVVGVSTEPVDGFGGQDRQMPICECVGRLSRTPHFSHG